MQWAEDGATGPIHEGPDSKCFRVFTMEIYVTTVAFCRHTMYADLETVSLGLVLLNFAYDSRGKTKLHSVGCSFPFSTKDQGQ